MNVIAARAAIIKIPIIINWENVIALPTFPVCEDPLTLTKANTAIAIAAKIFSSGNPDALSIISADFNKCPKNVPNATAYRLPAIVCANHAIQPFVTPACSR